MGTRGLYTCALLVAACGGQTVGTEDAGDGGGGDDAALPHVIQVSAAGTLDEAHTCALLSNGSVWCWGSNGTGQLGDGTTIERHTPVEVASLGGIATAVSAGEHFTCALLSTGAVRCWGFNQYGELGNGTTTSSPIPVDVTPLSGTAVAVSAGGGHACALLSSGAIQCWGYNLTGQVGDGTTSPPASYRLTPVDVVSLGGSATSISAGAGYTCAVLSTGGVQCWGDNLTGQLGNGTTTSSPIPVSVPSLGAPATFVSAGYEHTCAVTVAGGVLCWGLNTFGDLGGAEASSYTPTSVASIAGATTISIAGNHTCALTGAGAVECWGDWDNAHVTSATPTAVDLGAPVISIASGAFHTCGVLSSGSVRCWGTNNHGQLGDGTTNDNSVPVTVVGLP